MKRTLFALAMVSSAMAGDPYYLTQAIEDNTAAIRLLNSTLSPSGGGGDGTAAFMARHKETWDNWPPKEKPREFEGALIKFRSLDADHYNHPNSPGPEIRKAIPVAK